MTGRDQEGEAGAVRTGLVVSAILCLAEVVGGVLTNSLALLTDAVHMFTDVGALALTWFALWIGRRPASAHKTFGYYRAEILAAFVNGVVLCLLVVGIVFEAWRRVHEPPAVAAGGMLAVAAMGFLVNLFVAVRLHSHRHASLNLRGAYLHVLSDLVGSVGAIVAGAVILVRGWTAADAVASLVIAVLILRAAWALVREAVDVLMEGVPPHVDLAQLRGALERVAGVEEIHDLHVWTLTTGRYALSAHAVARGAGDGLLEAIATLCQERFAIEHVTVQIEQENRRDREPGH